MSAAPQTVRDRAERADRAEHPDRAGQAAASSRELILHAAESLFAERGYDGTSTARIAEAAGVTRTLIFHYFRTKERILVALLREHGADRILDGVGAGTGPDVARALTDLATTVHARLRMSRQVLQIIVLQRSLHPFVDDFFTALLERLDQLVKETIVSVLRIRAATSGPLPADLDAVVRMFAAVLLRDVVLERATGTEVDSYPVARACALALGAERAV